MNDTLDNEDFSIDMTTTTGKSQRDAQTGEGSRMLDISIESISATYNGRTATLVSIELSEKLHIMAEGDYEDEQIFWAHADEDTISDEYGPGELISWKFIERGTN